MKITEGQRRWLKKRVHHLKPVVTLGQEGLTEAVLKELEIALDHHELIKVKVNAGDRTQRDAVVEQIAAQTQSDLVDRIGNTAAFFRANPRKKAPLPIPSDWARMPVCNPPVTPLGAHGLPRRSRR
jgi:RNA-binding protein